MPAVHLCLIFEAIGDMGGIAKVAYEDVVNALQAGYRVTVVAQQLDARLRADVEWLPLYVPRRLFLLKWATARTFIRRAIGKRRFDLIHAHQPQAASLADVFTCHYLTQVAYERGCLESATTLRSTVIRLQQLAALQLEESYYRAWNPKTHMVFCSHLLQTEFLRLYGLPPFNFTIDNACPPFIVRSSARVKTWAKDTSLPVIGYLGGLDERKGFRRLLQAVRDDPGLFLLMGGSRTENFVDPSLVGRMEAVGQVSDIGAFYESCDVMVVPSFFDPNPMVVLEAVARGVPVIASDGVGNLHHLLRSGAGVEWKRGDSLGGLVRDVLANKSSYTAGAERMAGKLSREHRAAQMLKVYQQAHHRGN